MTIYCLGGVSGVGKTFLRRHHPVLSQLPCFDIADVYAEHGEVGWQTALALFVKRVKAYLIEDDPGADVVLEAFFRPGGVQREHVDDMAMRLSMPVRYIWVSAPRSVCLQRVRLDAQSGIDGGIRPQRRAQFIQEADRQFFLPIPGEQPSDVFPEELPHAPEDDGNTDDTRSESGDEEYLSECEECYERNVLAGMCPTCHEQRLSICRECVEPPSLSDVGSPKEYMILAEGHRREVQCERCRDKEELQLRWGVDPRGWEEDEGQFP